MRAHQGGRFRYGVHCVSREFQAIMQEISMALQRQQLRRLAGLARIARTVLDVHILFFIVTVELQ